MQRSMNFMQLFFPERTRGMHLVGDTPKVAVYLHAEMIQ